jgi:predicted transposase/invertase (TIGR01784 family)
MAFDNLCKYLAEKYPERFTAWLLDEPPLTVEVLKTELSVEPIRADAVFSLSGQRILHLEFQVQVVTEPALPLRMLDYWVRLYRRYRWLITQVVIFLKEPPDGTVIETCFQVEATYHEYRVVKLWQENPERFLQDPALLPFATLAATEQPEQLLQQVAAQLNRIEPERQRREIAASAQILAGLRFSKALVRQLLRGGFMRESVIYQDILAEGLQQGLQQGELNLILRLLPRRVGAVPVEIQAQIQRLSVAQLEALADALLDFTNLADLTEWLQTHAANPINPTNSSDA